MASSKTTLSISSVVTPGASLDAAMSSTSRSSAVSESLVGVFNFLWICSTRTAVANRFAISSFRATAGG